MTLFIYPKNCVRLDGYQIKKKEVLYIKNIDIIIPCYNSAKTLPSTLASIVTQSIKDQCNVYICDDCSTDNYTDILKTFSNMLNITYLRADVNGGAGQARQMGIDNSNSDYITFIDSDDTFNGAFAVELLYQEIKDNDCDMVSGKFINDNRETNCLFLKEYEKQLTWLHGKMYSRKFIIKNNIKFNELRLNEDGCFNQSLALKKARIKYLNDVVYNWITNKNSLTRVDTPLTRYNVLLSYIEGNLQSYKYAVSQDFYDKKVLLTQVSHALVLMYFYYNEIALTMNSDIAAQFMSECKKFYCKCYQNIEDEISDIDLRMRYYEILSSSDVYRGYFPIITFYDFCKEIGS